MGLERQFKKEIRAYSTFIHPVLHTFYTYRSNMRVEGTEDREEEEGEVGKGDLHIIGYRFPALLDA